MFMAVVQHFLMSLISHLWFVKVKLSCLFDFLVKVKLCNGDVCISIMSSDCGWNGVWVQFVFTSGNNTFSSDCVHLNHSMAASIFFFFFLNQQSKTDSNLGFIFVGTDYNLFPRQIWIKNVQLSLLWLIWNKWIQSSLAVWAHSIKFIKTYWHQCLTLFWPVWPNLGPVNFCI